MNRFSDGQGTGRTAGAAASVAGDGLQVILFLIDEYFKVSAWRALDSKLRRLAARRPAANSRTLCLGSCIKAHGMVPKAYKARAEEEMSRLGERIRQSPTEALSFVRFGHVYYKHFSRCLAAWLSVAAVTAKEQPLMATCSCGKSSNTASNAGRSCRPGK